MTIRIIIRDLLKDLGYTDVTEGRNGAEAWELMQKDQFDLLLTDIHMPQMSGLELVEKVKLDPTSTHAEIPCVFITSDTDYRQIEKARDLKAFGYIKKPFKREGLEAAIEAAKRIEQQRNAAAEQAAEQTAEQVAEPAPEPAQEEALAAQPAAPSTAAPAATATQSPPEPAQAATAVAEKPQQKAPAPSPQPTKKRGLAGWMRSIFG
jgi:two-component system chemotaxis response regulator CheY